MTIKELQKAKVFLDAKLTNSLKDIIEKFYETNGIIPNNVYVTITPRNIFIDTQIHPISINFDAKVKSEFKLT